MSPVCLIARAASRQKEIAIRLAIGAGRFRIIRQLLVESLLLSVGGRSLGLGARRFGPIARCWPSCLRKRSLSSYPLRRICGFCCSPPPFRCSPGLIFGLAPALQSTKPDVAPVLKDTVGGIVGGGTHVRVRKALVAAQVMLSLLLLIGAGLFIRSLRNLRDMGPGFTTGNLVAFDTGSFAERLQLRSIQDVLPPTHGRLECHPWSSLGGSRVRENSRKQ